MSVDCTPKSQTFNAVQQGIRDESASFNQAKCNVGHMNDPLQLKFQ